MFFREIQYTGMIDNGSISSDNNGTSTGVKRMRDSTTCKSGTHTKGGKEQASRIDNDFQSDNNKFFLTHIQNHFEVKHAKHVCNNVGNVQNAKRMQEI